ncbi:cellulose-binding protein [Lyngbya aestuarii]|uniref:cellulose-binding protein n=1 Tax=Lyngbya aestuarii TaxID=118322 RepID=UPI00403E1F0D
MKLRFWKFKNQKSSNLFNLATLFCIGLTLVLIACGSTSPNNQSTSLKTEATTLTENNTNTAQSNNTKSSALGTNLSGVRDWSTEMPFLDAFKSSRKWITQCASEEPGCNSSWDTHEEDKLDLDESGWVKSLPAPENSLEYTRVGTLLLRGVDPYPSGKYVVLYEGEGTIEYKFDAQKDEAASQPGRDVINVNPSPNGIHLIIASTDPNKTGNYLRNIRVVLAKNEDSYQSQIFNPKFIDKIKKFSAVRFMDWMDTNNSLQSEWANRPKVEDASYGYEKGVPIEIMVALANRLKVDPWFNIPHRATDEYITNFARLVKEKLDPNLTIYLEYSNEVWNPQFKQFHWLKENGLISKASPYQSYGVRTAQICDSWKSVFEQESKRIKCVMGTQTVNPWVAQQALNCDQWQESPCYKHGIDALAIASYFAGGLGRPEYESAIDSWLNNPKVDEFEQGITQLKNGSVFGKEEYSVKGLKPLFEDYSKIAQDKGLELVVYEGGTHVVGRGGVENNEKLTEFFIKLHRKPELYDIYTEMLEAWKSSQGTRTLFMHFTDIGKPSKWGSWGALEHVEQDGSPRYDALIDFIDKNA